MGEVIWLVIIIAFIVSRIQRKSMQQKEAVSNVQEKSGVSTLQKHISVPNVQQRASVPNVPGGAPVPDIMARQIAAPKMRKTEAGVIASRLMEGDPIPGGYRKAVCSYCAADNLVPEYGREKYICYFCHNEL